MRAVALGYDIGARVLITLRPGVFETHKSTHSIAGVFGALVAALDLAPAWKRRLVKDFNHKSSLAHDLDRLTISTGHTRPEYQGMLAALAGSDPGAAHALVTDLLSIAGISAVGGRSVGEIADRFLEQATLSVSDRGQVIAADARERLFSPFHRIPGRSGPKDTGLGLALVRQIARRHGGDAADHPERGSCFTVTLPALRN